MQPTARLHRTNGLRACDEAFFGLQRLQVMQEWPRTSSVVTVQEMAAYPEASPFAMVTMSGLMPNCWYPNHLPVRPMPMTTSSMMSKTCAASMIKR